MSIYLCEEDRPRSNYPQQFVYYILTWTKERIICKNAWDNIIGSGIELKHRGISWDQRFEESKMQSRHAKRYLQLADPSSKWQHKFARHKSTMY